MSRLVAPRPGNAKTCGQPAGELAVGAGGERGGAFVPNPDEAQLAVDLLAPHCVGEAEVAMADHAKHVSNAPGDHRFGHHIAGGFDVGRLFGQPHVDAVVSDLDGIRVDAVVVSAGAVAGEGMKIPAVPGATQPSLLDRSFAKRAPLVGTLIVERRVLTVEVRHTHGLTPASHRFHATFSKLVGF